MLSQRAKSKVERLLFSGAWSFRDIARQARCSEYTVRTKARELGIIDPDRPVRQWKKKKRCRGCGTPRGTKKVCPVCEHRLRLEIARRRRELARELKENPREILRRVEEFRRQTRSDER